MDEEKREVTAVTVRAPDAAALAPVAEQAPRYWGKSARALTFLWRVLLLVLAVFLVVFSALHYTAFSPLNLYYFGQDLKGLSALVTDDTAPLYYAYGGEGAAVLAYRGGVAVVGTQETAVFAADGVALLSVPHERAMQAPRGVVSRDYLIAYDHGGRHFTVINAHDVLYEGEAPAPILGAGLSDAGCFALIVASDRALSEVLLYDASFRLTHTFGRAAATVAAPLSADGRTLALVGATAAGAVVDIFTFGEEAPRATLTLDGFPLAADFTANGRLAVLTTTGLTALTSMGKLLEAQDFAGAMPTAYDIGENGVAVALQTDRLTGASRVLVTNRRGGEVLSLATEGTVFSVSVGEDSVFLLQNKQAACYRLKNGELQQTLAVPDDAISVAAIGAGRARVLCPAVALTVAAK